MKYIIKDLKDTTTDNYLKDTINCKGISIDDKLEMIKTYMADEIKSKLELERLLDNTKSVMIEVNTNDNEFKLLIDKGISIVVYSLEDLGSLIKKLNKKVDYEPIIQYLFHLVYDGFPYNDLDIKIVECLNSNTANDHIKKVTGAMLEFIKKDKPTVKKLGKYTVVTGVDISDNIDFTNFEIDNILYNQLSPIKEVIRKNMSYNLFTDLSNIKLNGSMEENTKEMFDYVMDCNNIYDKAYVMQSVLDKVLSIYFDTLKMINKEN